jgi:hypothetical protein
VRLAIQRDKATLGLTSTILLGIGKVDIDEVDGFVVLGAGIILKTKKHSSSARLTH